MSETRILQGPELIRLDQLLEKYRQGQNKFGDMIIGPAWVNLMIEKITGGKDRALALIAEGDIKGFILFKTGAHSVLGSMIYANDIEGREKLLTNLVSDLRKRFPGKSIVFPEPLPDMDIEEQKRLFAEAGFEIMERYKMEYSTRYEITAPRRPEGFTLKKYSRLLDQNIIVLDKRAYKSHPDERIIDILTDIGIEPPSLRIVHSSTAFFERNMSWFAMSGNRLAGAIYCTRSGADLWISNLVVDPDFQGRGLGKYLFFRTLEGMKKSNYNRCVLMVSAGNEAALKIYKNFKFKLKRKCYNFVYRTGQGVKNL
jgi:GNAT superfamily N-acetyltransferase